MLKGYKTFIVSTLAILTGVMGKHVAPDVLSEYGDVIIASIGMVFGALRVVTNSPVFQVVSKDLGLSPVLTAQIQGTFASLDPGDRETLSSAVADINGAVDRLTGHPFLQSSTLDTLTSVASLLPGLVAASARPAPAPTPVAQQPAPVIIDPAAQAAAQQQ